MARGATECHFQSVSPERGKGDAGVTYRHHHNHDPDVQYKAVAGSTWYLLWVNNGVNSAKINK